MNQKPIIYQILPRLFTNYNPSPVANGTLQQNRSGKLNDITPRILRAVRDLGVTHVWYTGVIEHAHDADYTACGIERDNRHVVKGHAGSPYAISDYYDIDPDLAVNVGDRISEFEALVRRTHDEDMKVIIDFVPNHVARRYQSDAKPAGIEDLGEGDNTDMFFSQQNNFYYITRQQFTPSIDLGHGDDAYIEFPAKATGNDCYTASPGVNDWYDTVKLNYGVDPWNGSKHFDPIPPTWFKMLHILRYWAAKGVDGFRCDMVHMVPVEFWRWAIANVKASFPSIIFIAEIYDVALYRPYIDAGFDYLYDKVNLYDKLRDIETGDISSAQLTSAWQTVEGIAPHMLNFLENHDEQRFASRQYAGDPHRVLPSLVVSAMISTGPMMIYFGQELGEPAAEAEGYSGADGRTTIFDYWSVASVRNWLNNGKPSLAALPEDIRRLRQQYRTVLTLCNNEAAIRQGSFFDLMYVNYNNHRFNPHRNFAFLRATDDELLLIAVNFGYHPAEIDINIPEHAFDCIDFPTGTAEMTELISGDKAVRTLSPEQPFTTTIDAHGAVIWKVRKSELCGNGGEADQPKVKKTSKKAVKAVCKKPKKA